MFEWVWLWLLRFITDSFEWIISRFFYILANFQEKMSNCASCKVQVQVAFVGKYCVRFGASIKQFCSNKCLEDHKKGLKVMNLSDVKKNAISPINSNIFPIFCRFVVTAKRTSPMEMVSWPQLGTKANSKTFVSKSVCKSTKLVKVANQLKKKPNSVKSAPKVSPWEPNLRPTMAPSNCVVIPASELTNLQIV